ncbi:hypothetical protein F4859DRAFT_239482 [Xylaria cf. heliscus]|nr:hypothetical protein F4859DRAFT_239482 [Xylaria cf. heliscus]
MPPQTIADNLSSRIFSVTGGASGIGAAVVRLLAEKGADDIWVADWNTNNFSQIKREVAVINPKTRLFTTQVDVSDATQVDAWIEKIIAESGALHGCANVAGLSQPAFSTEQPAILAETNEDWTRVLGVNINGIMYCTRAQVRVMLKLPVDSNPAIVNVSSIASLLRGPTAFAYGASKAACAHFTSCVAKDVHSFGIRANVVSPGNTYTPMTKEFFGNLSKEETEQKLEKIGVNSAMLSPSDIARVIVWLLSESSLHVNGVNLPVGEGAP